MTVVDYRISIPQPHTHLVHVEMRFTVTSENPSVALPSWTPGSYLMREFGRHIETLSLTVDGAPVEAVQEGKARWCVPAEEGAEAEVSYRVYAHDLTVRTAHVDGTHAFLMGTSLFLFVDGELDRSATLEVTAPEGWKTYTTLPEGDTPRQFRADDYDQLVDCPLELGPNHDQFSFFVRGVEHQVVLWGRSNADQEKLSAHMAEIVETNAALFDGLPYSRYLFIIHIADKGLGGLEHCDSCALCWPAHRFVDDDYKEFLRLVAHEHFHVWNVKRIRPDVLGPFDYLNESHTRALWAMEGVTSYFDKRQLLRAGLIDAKKYLEWVAKALDRLDAVPGRFQASLEQSSFDAWIKLYRPGENSPNSNVSYYLLGSLAALALDLEIRCETGGRKSFDDVIKLLWNEYLRTEDGLADDRFKEAIVEVGGQSLESWVRRYITEPAEIDWPRHLGHAGLALERQASSEGPELGIVLQPGGRVVVSSVLSDGPNHDTGLYPGDEIVALNGFQIDRGSWDDVKKLLPESGEIEIALFRRRVLHTIKGRVQPQPGKWSIVPVEDASEEQRALRSAWLFEQ